MAKCKDVLGSAMKGLTVIECSTHMLLLELVISNATEAVFQKQSISDSFSHCCFL